MSKTESNSTDLTKVKSNSAKVSQPFELNPFVIDCKYDMESP